MRAEERVEALCRQRGIYLGHEAPLVAAFKAHANECLEAAAKVCDERGIPSDGDSPYYRAARECAVALRALKE